MISTAETDAFAEASAVAALSKDWQRPFFIVIREGDHEGWAADLPKDIKARIIWITSESFESLGASSVPVTTFVREARVIDAAAGLASPKALRDHFGFVAAPRFPLSGHETLATESKQSIRGGTAGGNHTTKSA